jgi:peptide/nickel transport system substrate-binding protein
MRRLRTLAVPLLAALAVAACTSSNSAKIGSGSGVTGQKIPGGTVNVAWDSASPNFIFPYAPSTNTDGYNANLTQPLWPTLVYVGDHSRAVIDWNKSLAKSVTYSNNDTEVTITLQNWNWSDGKPVTSRDFLFTYNLLKAGYTNWNLYQTGLFPVNVASATAPDAHTVVLKLTRSYNPNFYTNDVLPTIQIIPQHAWDRTSPTGAVGNYDETPSGAKAVYANLQKLGGNMGTFVSNPLWSVVDGPWKLSTFDATTGDYSYVPNKNYSGPAKASLAHWINTTYTSDTAIIDSLRSGDTIQSTSLPLNDLGQIQALKAEGYSFASVPIPGVAGIYPNLWNASTGALARQLYIRQAIEYLINRQQIVKDVFHGYADPGNGPVPVTAFPSFASPLEKSGGPYPYSPSTAVSLLKSHGWTVKPGSVSTCAKPALCGAGITAGEPLSFVLMYSSGQSTTDTMNAAIQSSEEQAGIKLNLKPTPFNTMVGEVGICSQSSHPASACSWQLAEFGYSPFNGPYPAGSGQYNTGGNGNNGGYSSPTEDNLINQTEYGSSTSVFFQYEDYTARQLPQLWLPLENQILVYKSTLAGVAPLNPLDAGNNEQDWYYVK